MNKKKIAVEVIYNDKQTRVLGYKDIDPNSLTKKKCNIRGFVWIQYDDNDARRRILYDTQILTNF